MFCYSLGEGLMMMVIIILLLVLGSPNACYFIHKINIHKMIKTQKDNKHKHLTN